MPFSVEASGLQKHYEDTHAVDGLSFHISTRECFGFLGPNGAGKTTTMRMLYGRIQRSAGDLRVLGRDPSLEPRAIRERIGVVPQEHKLDYELPALDNLLVHAGYFGLRGPAVRRRAMELLDLVELGGRAQAKIHELSGGMQRRLLIARSLISDPEMLILDEPTTGLDPQARLVVWQRLAELKDRGVTIIVTTHYMEEASRLCDRLVIMDRGRVVGEGSPRELIARHAGEQVVEVPWPFEAELPDLEGGGVRRVDRAGDRLLVFAADPVAALDRLRDGGVAAGEALVRPASLEDVFLHLTGRGLSEGEDDA